jgi:low temperature requirement protein LtrA
MASQESPSATTPSSEQGSTVSWFELFYDLVVVAAVSLTNDVFLAEPSLFSVFVAAISMTALAWVWFLTTLCNNLFPGQDILRRALLVTQMAAIVVAGLAVDQQHGISNRVGLVAYGISLLIVAILLVWGSRQARRPVHGWTIVPILLAASVCLLGSVAMAFRSVFYLVLAIVVSAVPILTRQYARWHDRSQLRLDHLRERLGLFVLIILGEGFAQLVAALHGRDTIPRGDLFALMFLLSFALWWIYFDGTFSRHTDLAVVRWRLSLLAHLTLVFGVAGTLDILVLLTAQEGAQLGDAALLYFVVCLALALLSFAALGFSAKGRMGPAGWTEVGSAVGVLAVGLLFVPRDDSAVYAVIAICGGLVIGNAVLAVWADAVGERRHWGPALGPAMLGDDPPLDGPE